MTDIELVPTDDLIAELMGRYEDAVFMGFKSMSAEQPSFVTHEFCGEPYRCLGLCATLSHLLAHVRDDITTDADDGDEIQHGEPQ